MRIAVIADILGNMLALEAVLGDIERRGVDLTINLYGLRTGWFQPRQIRSVSPGNRVARVSTVVWAAQRQ